MVANRKSGVGRHAVEDDASAGPWPALLSAALVARYVGLGKSTVWQLLAKDEFPQPIKVGGRTLWKRASVDDWIAEQQPVPK